MSYAELLRRITIFKDLDEAAVEELSGCLKPMEFARDALIVGQDEKGDALYIIQRGRVKVVLYGESGREVILTMFRAGDFFGEMSLLDGEPRSANVMAVETTQALVLARADFLKYIAAHPNVGINVLSELCRRLRHADSVIGNLALLDVYGRVGRILIDLGKREGEPRDEGIYIKVRPTQQDLANMIGTSRETVSRVLSGLQRQGFLSMQGRSLLLSAGFAEQLTAGALSD